MPRIKYVLGLAFNEDLSKVVLIEKLKPEWQKGKLNGVGGKIEEIDGLPVNAMVREFKEETGVDTLFNHWKYFLTYAGPTAIVETFMLVDPDVCWKVRTVEKEVVGVYDTKALPENVVPNLKWIIPLAIDNARNRWSVTAIDMKDVWTPL